MANVRLRVLPQILPVDGRPVEIQATDTYIQWRYVDDADWINLVALADLTGPPGPSIELRSDGTNIQYRIVGSGEEGWVNIVPLADLQGPPGGPGPAGPGVPPAGTTGQVLGKVSGDDFDTEWIDPPNDFTSAAESRAWAIANLHPDVAPSYIRTAGYSSPGDTGGALYKEVISEPSHAGKFSITLADAVTVVWYEIAEPVLRPAMFGAVHDGVADDTSALQAMLNAGKRAHITSGTYKLTNLLTLDTRHHLTFDADVTLRQYTASTPIFRATSKSGIVLDVNGATLRGEGTYGGNPGGPWTGTGNSNDRAIEFRGCTDSAIIRPHTVNCGLAGISLLGGSRITVVQPVIEGTNLYSSPILSQGNFQSGIYIMDHATYGVTTDIKVVEPDISGTAQGVLVESYPSLDYSDRFLQFIAPNVHDVTGQHAFYLQSGGVIISNPAMRDIELSGVKVQSSADNNLNIRNIVAVGAIGERVKGNLFEIANLGSGSISNAMLSGVGDSVGTGIAIVGNINDLKANLVLATVTAHAALLQGDGADDIDLTIFARDMGQHGIVVTATNANNVRLRPVLRNPNTGNTAGQCGIIVASASAKVDVFDPDITDANTRMRYAAANTVAGGVLRLHGRVNLSGYLTGLIDNSAAPITGNFWQSYIPTVAASTGAITASSATGEWRQDNDAVFFRATATITTNGTGAGLIDIGLPKTASGTGTVSGRETGLTGKSLNGEINVAATVARCAFYDNTYPGANGAALRISGFYKAAS